MSYGSYNNQLADLLANPTEEIAWMARNKTNPNGWDDVSLYRLSTSELNSAEFAQVVLLCYLKKIRLGAAWSTLTRVDEVIAYNARQTDFRKKLYFMTPELEAEYANNNCTIAEYRAWIPAAYAKLRAAGIKHFIYEGWNYQYDVTVGNCDEFWLHAYRTEEQMLRPDDMYNYLVTGGKDRVLQITAESKKKGIITHISLLTSCENVKTFDNPPKPINDGKGYGWKFYQTRPFGSAYPIVKAAWDRLATQDMKDWIIFDGEVVFVSRHAHLIKA